MGIFGTKTRSEADQQAGITLILGEKHVTAAWWQVTNQKIGVQQTSEVHHFADHHEGLVEVDSALQELKKASEDLDSVIFGVEPNWMAEKGELAEEAKAWLKKVADSLNLQPVGFVVTLDAYIQHLLHAQAHLNAIVVYAMNQEIVMTVVRQGTVQLQERVGRSGNVAADVVEALARHETAESIWPAKMWLASASLDEDEIQTVVRDFQNYSWSDATPWSASPLIEVVSGPVLAEAVSTEGGRAVTGLPPSKDDVSSTDQAVIEQTSTDKSSTDNAHDEILTDVPPIKSRGYKRIIFAGVGMGLMTVLIGSYFFLMTTVKATVVITPKTTRISQTLPVEFSTKVTSPVTNATLLIPATAKTVQVTVTQQGPATGVKKIGESSKGQITLLNKTTSAKMFAQGTVVTLGTVQFTTDTEATVASASVQSAGDSETKTFGKATVGVTASKIGTEGNIPSNSSLVVAAFDQNTYAATNETSFTGGSSSEVRAVAEEDLQNLLKSAKTEALRTSETLLREQLSEGQYALPTGQLKVIKSEYSSKVGDQVDAISLTYQAEVSGVVYQASTLRSAVETALEHSLTANTELLKDKLEMMTQESTPASQSAQVQLRVEASAPSRPKVDTQLLAQELAGVPLDQVNDTLSKVVPITKYQVYFQPSLATSLLRALPVSRRLTVIVE